MSQTRSHSRLEIKPGAEAAKKSVDSSALLEDKKHNKLYFCYYSLGKKKSFYG